MHPERRVCLALLALARSRPSPRMQQTASIYTKESLQEYEKQLTAGEIAVGDVQQASCASLRITLKNGSHVLATYPKKQRAARWRRS